ncbi:aminopeptidase P family protein [Candidatus Aerophobetes bacterium]|nr:aminopeptidase P family protein [Candidatus Aerophobetes bacterium]
MKEILQDEFDQRIRKIQEEMTKVNLDVVLVQSNEADFANVRYLSDYWPIFEQAGIIVPQRGEAILLIGPESETFARDRSKIKKIRKILQYRESAEPDYPDMVISSFKEVLKEACGGREINRLGIIGYSIMPLPVYEEIKRVLPQTEIVQADELMFSMRVIKSENEIILLREASHISEIALEQVLNIIKPGMSELQVVGVAQKAIYDNGAEYEGMPQYVLSGKNTTHAISRSSHKTIQKNELVQLNISARVGGYSSSVGRPVFLGKMSPEMKEIVQVGLDAHRKTRDLIKAQVMASQVVKGFYDFVDSKGYRKNVLYGPCHGIGLVEVERPWMELNSEYLLEENMTFQVDTFMHTEEYGFRWENGVRVTKDGVECLSDKFMQLLEID